MSGVFQRLKKVRGLGAGHNGTHHFIAQRVAGLLLIPLVLYFFCAIVSLVGADSYQEVKLWFGSALNMALSSAFIIVGFFQSAIGLQVVVEDYVHHDVAKFVIIVCIKGVALISALTAVFSILRLGFSS